MFNMSTFGGGLSMAADAAAAREKIDLTVVSPNLFRRSTATDGYFLSELGVLTASASYGVSDFIPVTPGIQYYGGDGILATPAMRFTCYYDANKAVVAGGSNADIATFTPPAGAAFVRVSYYVGRGRNFQLQVGSAPTLRRTGEPLLLAASTRLPSSGAAFLKQTKNLFNPAAVVDGYFITNSTGVPSPNAAVCYSDWIAVDPGQRYIASQAIYQICYFDPAFSPVAGTTAGTSFTVPAGVKWLRISVQLIHKYIFQLEKTTPSGSATQFEPYGSFLSEGIGGPAYLSTGAWQDRIWSSFGDSITEGGNWQNAIVSALGLKHYNFGVSGTTVTDPEGTRTTAMCRDERVNLLQSGSALVTLMGGTNDWAQSIPLGAITDTVTTSYYGALQVACAKIQTRFPLARIVLITPPYGRHTFAPDPEVNTLDLRPSDYGAAMIAVGRKLGHTVIDSSGMGVNAVNYTSFYNDGLHPNSGFGGRRLSDLAIAHLSRFYVP